jgi:hypothetical protein
VFCKPQQEFKFCHEATDEETDFILSTDTVATKYGSKYNASVRGTNGYCSEHINPARRICFVEFQVKRSQLHGLPNIGIGMTQASLPVSRKFIGLVAESYSYSSNGLLRYWHTTEQYVSPKTFPGYETESTISLLYDGFANTLQFYTNGRLVDTLSRVNPKTPVMSLYPGVTLHYQDDTVTANKKTCAISKFKLVELYFRVEHSIGKRILENKLSTQLRTLSALAKQSRNK